MVSPFVIVSLRYSTLVVHSGISLEVLSSKMMELSTIVFHMDSQPDYEKLKEKGWYHPTGFKDEPMLDSLIKDFGDYQIQIVHHHRGWDYTEAFLHSKPERPVVKKGEGKGMPLEVALDLIGKLYEEVG